MFNVILQSVLTVLLSISGVVIAFWVLLTNWKSAAHRYLFILITLSTSYIFLDFFVFLTKHTFATEIERVVYGLACVVIGVFYLFSLNFPRPIKQKIFITIPVLLFTSVFFYLSVFTKQIIAGTRVRDWGIELQGGRLELAFGALAIVVVAISLLMIYKQYRRSLSNDRRRVRFFFFGVTVFIISEAVFAAILPALKMEKFSYFGDYSILVLFFLTSYAIIKHRLMDIRMIVARSMTFTIMIGLVAFFYVASVVWIERVIFVSPRVSTVQIIYRIIISLIVIFTFQPLKNWITKKTDKIFFKQSYDPDVLLERLSHTMGSTIVLIELLYKILNILTEEMKVSRGFFVVLKDKHTIDTIQGMGYKKSPGITLKEIELFGRDGVFLFDDLDENSKEKRILRKHEASVAIPLKSSNKFSGILFLGEKSSGDMYSAQDINIFEILGPQVAVALENAKSYEEIQQFNTLLRSEVQKATKDLEVANTNLRELDRAKDEFISMASHQLRTPLTAIKGYLSMLLEGDAGEIKKGQNEFIQEAYYGATRMVSLINDLLNVSRMETGRFFMEVTEFDVVKSVSEEVKQLEKAARDKGLKLIFQKHSDKITLCADEMKVRQVMMNFIDNAIYYTPRGKVMVSLYDEGKNVRFEVRDSGIGVPRAQQHKLFTKFYRAANARSTRPDGTGLGLFLAKKVIEQHKGEVIFHSSEGKGSTFGFRLPKKAKLTRGFSDGFDSKIPLETPVDKAIKVMDDEIKKEAAEGEKEKALT